MQPRQIMLVDDEPRLLAALKRRLSSSFDIVTFERGRDALDYLSKDHNVAVIVADMQMPEMNGIELLKEVQAVNPNIRRLMLTGNSDQETAIAAINEGKVLRFIRKPCEAMALKDILIEALAEFEFSQVNLADITKNDEGEAGLLEQAQQTFLSIMSDELRTPLSQIITISKILVERRQQTEAEIVDKYLRQINESGQTALGHIDRILRYTHLQSSHVREDQKEDVDVVALFKEEASACDALVKSKLLTLSVESLRKTAFISAVPSEVKCAVREVMQNAIKYSDVGGHVSILFRFEREMVAVRIANSLTSDGTPETRLTEGTFKHAHQGLDGEHSGVGLGLSLVNLIADRNDAHFKLEQRDNGCGVATFIFRRPELVKDIEPLPLAS